MTDYYTYQKKRMEFGRSANFEDVDIEYLGGAPQIKKNQQTNYVMLNPTKHVLDNIPATSEHSVNTERVNTQSKAMKHTQGGWPKECDPTEPADTQKYRRKLEKDPNFGYGPSVSSTSKGAIECIRQNNQNDMFEEYFAGEVPEH